MAHYVDINMVGSLSGEGKDYHLIGEGVESLTEEFNAETETKQWINQANGDTSVKSYTPNINIDIEDVDQEDTELTDFINNMIDTLPTGSAAVTSYVRVRLNKKVSEGKYKAVQRLCAISVGSTGGDAGSNVGNSISIGGKGDGVQGTFDVTNKTFIADTQTLNVKSSAPISSKTTSEDKSENK